MTDRFPAARLVLASVLVLATVPFVAGPAWAQRQSAGPGASQGATTCAALSPPPIPAPSAPMVMPEDFRLGLLDDVWQQLNDGYVDPGMNGVDWESVHTDYAQRMLEALNAYEAYATLSEMVGLLQDPDTFFASAFDLEGAGADPTIGGAGILVDSTAATDPGEGIRVVYVFPGSPAQAAGIAPRDVILEVDGDPCPRPELVRGPIGSSVSLLVRSPGEEPRTVELARQRIAPAFEVKPERAPHAKSMGYLRLLSMAGDTADQAGAALTQLLDQGNLSGLVLDLRHASAGDPAVTKAILGQFTGGEAGTLVDRNGTTPYVVEAQPLRDQLQDVPVVVLVDAATDGEAERLAAVLQSQGRAKVVGQRTPGHTQLIQQSTLPEGSLLQMVVGGMLLPDGTRLEGHGVIPDIEMDDDWLTQPADKDTWIAAAVKELRRSGLAPGAPAATRLFRSGVRGRIDGMIHRRTGGLGALLGALLALLLLPIVPVGAQSPSPVDASSPLPGASAAPVTPTEPTASAAASPGAPTTGAPGPALDPDSPAGRLVALREVLAADRLLLAELRKDVPYDRTEAEAYLAHVEDLALVSDPARLGVIVSRVRAAAPAWLDWRAQQYPTTQEAANAYVSSGAAAFDESWGNLHDAVLLTVVDRLDTIIELAGRFQAGE